MNNVTYLAALRTDEATSAMVISVYLTLGELPPERISTPALVGFGPVEGNWRLAHWEHAYRAAYYLIDEVCPAAISESDAAGYLDL